jgi:hypothetical protein
MSHSWTTLLPQVINTTAKCSRSWALKFRALKLRVTQCQGVARCAPVPDLVVTHPLPQRLCAHTHHGP